MSRCLAVQPDKFVVLVLVFRVIADGLPLSAEHIDDGRLVWVAGLSSICVSLGQVES